MLSYMYSFDFNIKGMSTKVLTFIYLLPKQTALFNYLRWFLYIIKKSQ